MIRALGALIAARAGAAGAPAQLLGAGATASAVAGAGTVSLSSASSSTSSTSSALLLLRRCLQTGTPAEAAAASATTKAPKPAAGKKSGGTKKAAAGAAADGAKKKKKKKTPAVARPLSAYTLFTKDNAKDIMQRQGLSAPDAMRALAARWAALGAGERAPYLRRAAESKAAADAARAEIKARRPPPSAYSAFSAEVMRELRAGHPPAAPTDCVRMAAERWRRLSAGERQKLEDAARAARDAWRAAGGGAR